MARILIAASKPTLHIVHSALINNELLETTLLAEAQRLVIEDGIELFLIDIEFDDSRAIELATFIRRDARHRATPIVITQFRKGQLADFIKQTMETMIAVEAISDYLELDADSNPERKIQLAVKKLLQSTIEHDTKMIH